MIKKSLGISLLLATMLCGEDLGIINVESSTIDDKFNNKKSEVSNTSTISATDVDNAHIDNIDQILKTISGVTSEVTTGDSLKIHIRGVENQMYMGEKPGVAVVIDGVPVFERTGRVNIDLDNIESIKVIKGGASYLFGDDALSGAVVITTKRGAKYNNSYLSTEFGSYGYSKFLARQGFSNEKFNAHIQISQRESDGYHEDSNYLSKYLNGKVQYYIDDSSDLTFGLEMSKREKDSHGTVGGVIEADTNPESVFTGNMESRDYTRHYDVELQKYFLTYSKDFENSSNLMLNAYLYKDETSFISSPQTKDASGSRGIYTDDDYVYDNDYSQIQKGVKAEYRMNFDSSAMLFGLDLRENNYKNKIIYRVGQRLTYRPPHKYSTAGEERSNNDTDESVYAVYGEYKYAFTTDFSMTTNLRYDKIKLDYSDSSANTLKKEFDVWSYRLGANYQLTSDWTLYTNYSTGFRAPTISQLFAGDVSTYGSTQNNPDLEPERADNYEIGVRGKYAGFTYDLSLFMIDRKDFIMKTSGNYGDTDTTDMWANIGGARHTGLEFSVKGNLIEDLYMGVAYTYLDAKYTDYKAFGIDLGGTVQTFDVSDNSIPRTPKHRLNIMLDYKITPSLTLNTNIDLVSKYYADDLNRLEIEEHTTVDMGLSYTTKISKYEVSLFAKVENLFDKHYYNSARANDDRDENGVFDYQDLSITVNQGRFYSAGLSLKF
ncbi:MAG: TonB-dependent receptor [Sulfurovum sp.]